MTWMEGKIVKFKSPKPEHRDLRKVRTEPGQDWNDQYFFHVSLAREAGYPLSALEEGSPIRFEPDPDADRRRVLRFEPYEPRERTTPRDTSDRFLNPYHFIGLEAPSKESLVEATKYLAEAPLHDRFAALAESDGREARFSGRVLVQLTTEGPVVVGSTQERADGDEDRESVVAPFTLPDPDAPADRSRRRPAIPGSSLRGMLSSLVEAASSSAMRVLKNQEYSYSAGRSGGRRNIPGNLFESVELVSKDLLPFHSGRGHLTLAERLFGFVEHDGRRALAGRVRVAHAITDGEPKDGSWFEESVLLKILSSPKPLESKPTVGPAFYFGNHGYLSKAALDLNRHAPQGRKVYLHHREGDIRERRFETGDPENEKTLKQKMRVEPLKDPTSFLFHIDFVNLTRHELGFLLYALRPTEAFRHKVGLGKPIGLGQVVIEPLALAFIDRLAAYGPDGLFGAKYHSLEWTGARAAWQKLRPFLERRYRSERRVDSAGVGHDERFPSMDELRARVRESIPEKIRKAIELVGDPSRVTTEVTYPVLQGQGSEGEHYQWFQKNDTVHQRVLEPIEPDDELPTLIRYSRDS